MDTIPTPSGCKACLSCKSLLPATQDYFRPNPYNKHRLQPQCRSCQSLSKRLSRRGLKNPTGYEYAAMRHILCGITERDCWNWTGSLSTGGYGCFYIKRKFISAHRAVYELLSGPIPEGLHLDHLCRNRKCVNPAHLEPVTQRENFLRGYSPSAITVRTNQCKQGHSLTGDNLFNYISRQGVRNRMCKTCRNARARNNWPKEALKRKAKLSTGE